MSTDVTSVDKPDMSNAGQSRGLEMLDMMSSVAEVEVKPVKDPKPTQHVFHTFQLPDRTRRLEHDDAPRLKLRAFEHYEPGVTQEVGAIRASDGTVTKQEPEDVYQPMPYNPDDEYQPPMKMEPLAGAVVKACDGKAIKQERQDLYDRVFDRFGPARPYKVADPTRLQRNQRIRRNEVPMEEVVDLTGIKEEGSVFRRSLATVNAHSYGFAGSGAPANATPIPGVIMPNAKAARFRAQLSMIQREKANLAIDGTNKLKYGIDSPTAMAAQQKLQKELRIDGTKKLGYWSHKGTDTKTRSQFKKEMSEGGGPQFESEARAGQRIGGAVYKRFAKRSSKRLQRPSPLGNATGRYISGGKIEKPKRTTTQTIKERKEAESYARKAISNGSAQFIPAETARDGDDDTPWCLCRKPVDGPMLCCDNDYCNVGWFHFDCVGMSDARADGDWFCFECRMTNAIQ